MTVTTVIMPGTTATPRPMRRRLIAAYYAVVIGLAAVVGIVKLMHTGLPAAHHAEVWLVAALALLAGTQAFVSAVPGGETVVICPAICFTFAILLCWGLGPAIIVQALAVIVMARRLRLPMIEAALAGGQYALAFTAAAIVLWLGHPDPMHHVRIGDVVADSLVILSAVLVWLVVYGVIAYIGARLRTTAARSRRAAGIVGYQMLFKAALLLLSPVLAIAADHNFLLLLMIFVPLYAVQRMARLSAERDRAARIDPLTDLTNRSGLRARFDELTAPGDDRPAVSLLMMDLDRFKQVNDTLGHEVGDQLLVAVARRLGALEPAQGAVARLGGDEFAILVATGDPTQAIELARSVVSSLSEPLTLDGLRVDVTASIGVAAHERGEDFGSLMRHADIAMYEAKRRTNAIAVYDSGADHHSPLQLSLLTDFRTALESDDRHQIVIAYQPQVSLADGRVEGVEALLRWHHPEYGLINTQDLLALAEHSSVMHLLTLRVITDVASQLGAWARQGVRPLRASINVSARDLYSEDIVSHLAVQLARQRVDPAQLQIEITESALMADPTRALATVNGIAALGVAVSLDDFGTGYSSLQHLRKMPISEIKIDRSFVAGMADNRDDAAIVRTTVDLATSLGIRTVAEGVETEYTRRLLSETGCALAQGWLTARPMPPEQLTTWLREQTEPTRDVVQDRGTGSSAPAQPTAVGNGTGGE
jgi:diguanylate cyclase (GGDEF)-like protein